MRTKLNQLKRPPAAPFTVSAIAQRFGLKPERVRTAAKSFKAMGKFAGANIYSPETAKQIARQAVQTGRSLPMPPALGAMPGETVKTPGNQFGPKPTSLPQNSRPVTDMATDPRAESGQTAAMPSRED